MEKTTNIKYNNVVNLPKEEPTTEVPPHAVPASREEIRELIRLHQSEINRINKERLILMASIGMQDGPTKKRNLIIELVTVFNLAWTCTNLLWFIKLL